LAAGKRILSDDEPEIKATMDENERQKEMRKNQIANATVETQQNPVEQFQGQGDQNSGQASNRIVRHSSDSHRNCDEQEITKITQNQQPLSEISTAPYSIIAVLPSQVQFVDDANGDEADCRIVVSYGAMNQMEKSGKILLVMPWEKSRR
jgi:hypothetical protein